MTSFADPGFSPPQPGDNSRDVQVNLDADVSGYTAQVGAAQQATAGLAGTVGKLSLSLTSLTKFAGRQLFHFAAADFAGLSAAVADAASLQQQMGTLRATAAVTGSSMREMGKGLDDAFSKFPVGRRDLIQLTEAISNMGITAPKAATHAAETFTKLGGATGENPIGLATSSIQLDRMMGNTKPEDIDKYANSVLLLSKNYGVASSSILEFSQAIAPMARAAGIGQAAIQGIATAFSAAGADGAYAANTFNKMVTEIETLKETGSPEIGKYASFLGESSGQFRNQNATQSATQLFSQIGKGGPEALNFVSSLGLGPRDLKAIQAVAQSGLLGGAIDTAKKGAAGGTADLDKAAAAAFSGLSDSIIKLGNQFTKLGEIMGTPFLGPLEKAVELFGSIVGTLNKVLSLMGPLPSIVASLVGLMAVPAGIALTHFGATTALAVGRSLNRGPTMTAFREGRGAIQGGMTQTEALAAGAVGQRVASGEAGFLQRTAFNAGMSRGAAAAAGSGWGARLGGVARGGFGGALGAGTWFMNTGVFRRAGEEPKPGLRESMRTGSVMGLARAGTRMITSTVREGTAAAANLTGRAASLAAAGIVPPGVRAATAAGYQAVAPVVAPVAGMAARAAAFAFNPLTMIGAAIAVPLIGSIVSSIKEGNAKRADISGGLTGAGVYDQGLNRVSTNLARFGQSVDAAADKLSKFADTPITQLGKVTGEDIAAVQGSDYKVSDDKLTAIIDQAKKDAAQPGGDPRAVEKAVGTYLDAQSKEGPIKGDAFVKYRRDILSDLGTSQAGPVSDIMTDFAKRQGMANPTTPDFGGLAALAARTGGTDAGLENFKKIFGAGVTGLTAATQNSGVAGTRAQLVNLLSMGAKATGTADEGQRNRITALNSFFQTAFQIDPKQFAEQQKAIAKQLGTTSETDSTAMGGRVITRSITPYKSEADAQRVQIMALAQTDKGKELLSTLNLTVPQLLKAVQAPGALPAPTESGTATALRAAGPLGRYAAGDASFMRAATGSDSGRPGAEFAAAIKLSGEAAGETGGDLSKAASSLDSLSDKMGGVTDSTGALIASASDWARMLASFRLPTLTRAQQYNELADTSRRDMAAAQAPGASDRTKAQGTASRQAFEGAQESQRQTFIGQIKEVEAFNTSRRRAAEANNLQISRSNRDFGVQQTRAEESYNRERLHAVEDFGVARVRAEEDYNLSVQHAQQDFATSQLRAEEDYQRSRLRGQQDYQLAAQRSQEDYQKNVDRQTADHLRDLQRQAQAAAQSIYDPFTRVQVKATTDAGTLIYNLKEQNADIARQMKELKELRDKGISQQTIDTLQLGNAENAQQVTTLNRSLEQNPNMVGQINSQVATRVQDTTALTQNPANNVGFRQSQEDFSRSMSRGSEDFSKTQARAAADQSKTMSRMSVDFNTTTTRAASDQARSLHRMGVAFSTQQSRAADDQEKTLARQAEAFSISQDQAVKDHAKALSDLAADYKKTQKQAAEDLATSLKEYSGNFVTIMGQLSAAALGSLKTYAPQAVTIIDQAIKDIRAKMASPLENILNAGKPAPAKGTLGPNMGIPQGPAHSAFPGFAFGGISLTQQRALVSEHGPEAHIPLNSHGEDFMAGLIARSLAQGVTTAVSGGAISSTNVNTDNSISFAGAEIQVVAQDPDQMAKQLAGKAKLRRLASPVRH